MSSLRTLAVSAAQQEAARPVDAAGLPHRETMRRAKVLISLAAAAGQAVAAGQGAIELDPDPSGAENGTVSGGQADRETRSAALRAETSVLLDRLTSLQTTGGTFRGGDNVLSPPDSAFTINDACDAHHLLAAALRAGTIAEEWENVRTRLAEVIRHATPALLAGGAQTPNHRWEISAALARIHRDFRDPRLVERIDQWLAEGIDIDAGGHYSERSANYASAVSNPSLIALARILGRSDLLDVVEHNLVATLPLIGSDDTVETVQSRRQDQGSRFGLAPYLLHFRALAIRSGRGDLAWAARRAQDAAESEGGSPELLTALLLDPGLERELPPAKAPDLDRPTLLETVGLAVRRSTTADTVVYGGSDYARHRRIRSGLANDPTFARLLAGSAVLDSVRLSREFFGLGPFRADRVEALPDGRVRLTEQVSAAYYQPLAEPLRAGDGTYELTDDGRFSASMSFGERNRDLVGMETTVVARLLEDGMDLDVAVVGPEVPFSLEFTFRAGGVLVPLTRTDDTADGSVRYRAAYRCGARAITVDVEGLEPAADPLPYRPGEDYSYLHGTDSTDGVKLLVGSNGPAAFSVRLRAVIS